MGRHLHDDNDPAQTPPDSRELARLTVLIVLLGCDLEEEVVAWAAACRTPGGLERSRPLLAHPLGGRQTARVVGS